MTSLYVESPAVSGASAAVVRSLDDDVAAITAMFASVTAALSRPEFLSRSEFLSRLEFPSSGVPVITTTTANARTQRIVIYRPDVLLDRRHLSFVGFFGERRRTTPPELVAEVARVDERMLVELETIPGVAAYCSLQLDSGDWANLVVLADDTAYDALHANPTHRYAAHRLSPMFYTSIRLHHGQWCERATVTSTKQYEFATAGAPRVSVIDHTRNGEI